MLQAIDTWQFIGPVNLNSRGGENTQVRNGRINAVAFDPRARGTYYAGAPYGGVWKTTNGGADWTPLSDNWRSLSVSSIAVEPENPQHLYVGTGDVPKQGPYAMGLMRSQDGGTTWQPIGPPELSTATISRVIVDVDAPNVVMAAEFGPGGRIWRSTTYGDTWGVVIPTQTWWTAIEFGPMAANWYAIGEGNGGGQLWHSQDHGQSWNKLASPLRAFDQRGQPIWQQRPLVAASPVFPERIYVFSQTDQKVFVSSDNGQSWRDVTGSYVEQAATMLYTFCMACSSIVDATSGASQDVLFLGQYGVSATTGDGNWQQVAYDNAHADQHAIAFDPFVPPGPTTGMLIGNDGGVYYALYGLGGAEIVPLSARLAVAECYSASYSPQAKGVVIAGLQDTGSAAATGDLSAWTDVTGGDGGLCQIMPLSSTGSLQYATVNFSVQRQTHVLRTADLWTSSQDITNSLWAGEPGASNSPGVLDPSRPWLLYVATNYLYRWNDTGALSGNVGHWDNRLGGQQLASGGQWVNVIEVCQGDFNRIYTGSTDREIWMSPDTGATWRRIDVAPLPSAEVRTITSHPNNPNDILVGFWMGSGFSHMWRCPDTRNPAWHDVGHLGASAGLPDIPVETIVRDIWDPTNTWYVGTDAGVFCTDDAGGHWAAAGTPLHLPNTIVQQLTVDSLNQVIYAATFGRGLWRNTLSPPPQMTLTLNSHVLLPGGSTAGTLTFDRPAPIGGAHVTMISTNPAVIVEPFLLTVPVNGKLGLFTVNVGAPDPIFGPFAQILAVYGGRSASAVVQIA
jgi:photosystem II stability/assembly factor-like uncharacterized protein